MICHCPWTWRKFNHINLSLLVTGILTEFILFMACKETIPRTKEERLITEYRVRMFYKRECYYGTRFLLSLYPVDPEERLNTWNSSRFFCHLEGVHSVIHLILCSHQTGRCLGWARYLEILLPILWKETDSSKGLVLSPLWFKHPF